MNNRTRLLVEETMAHHGIETHTEAVRLIVDRHEERDLAREVSTMRTEISELKKELSHVLNLVVFMAESMSASTYQKAQSRLYAEAVQLTDLEELANQRLAEERRAYWSDSLADDFSL